MQPTNNRREHHGVHSGHKSVPPRPAHSRPSGEWRKFYECKVNKGAHTLVLVKPHFFYHKRHGEGDMSAVEYYDMKDREYKTCLEKRAHEGVKIVCWRPLYEFKCTACGKQEYKAKRV